jgi:hypothetical protein
VENKNLSPCCSEELIYDKGSYICKECSKTFKAEYYCDKCESEVEKLQACGATNFFCNSCNELKSKSKIVKKFKEI